MQGASCLSPAHNILLFLTQTKTATSLVVQVTGLVILSLKLQEKHWKALARGLTSAKPSQTLFLPCCSLWSCLQVAGRDGGSMWPDMWGAHRAVSEGMWHQAVGATFQIPLVFLLDDLCQVAPLLGTKELFEMGTCFTVSRTGGARIATSCGRVQCVKACISCTCVKPVNECHQTC